MARDLQIFVHYLSPTGQAESIKVRYSDDFIPNYCKTLVYSRTLRAFPPYMYTSIIVKFDILFLK